MAAAFSNPSSVYTFEGSEPEAEYDVGDLSNENKNTKRKTETDMRIFCAYLISLKEMRNAEDIPPQELDPYLSMFFSVVKKHDGHDYEPASLRGMLCSIERYLRMKGYQCSITRDVAFNNTRNTLKNKQKILRENGKGLKKLIPFTGPEPLGPSTMEKLNHLYAAKELGPYNPMSVINSICFAFVLNLKMRKAIEHKQLLWGDIVLKSSPSGEYLCYEPLEGKEYIRPRLKGIDDCCVWSNPASGPNKDTILIYKLYSQKRPAQMMNPESPFYLGVSTSHPVHNQPWYKSLPMGVNKLNDLVRMIRDITGIQKAQTYSNPGSPENAARCYISSPCIKSFHHATQLDANEEDVPNAMDEHFKCKLLVTEDHNVGPSHSGDAIPVCDNTERKMEMIYGKTPTSELGLKDANVIGSAIEGRLSKEMKDIAESNDACISMDEAKTLIRGLIEKVDSDKREELVEWMTTLKQNSDKPKLPDNKQQGKYYQITLELNTNELDRCHELDISGRLKLVSEFVHGTTAPCTNSEHIDLQTHSDSQQASDSDSTSLTNRPAPTDKGSTGETAYQAIKDQNNINSPGVNLVPSPLILKRSASERPYSQSSDITESKRSRPCRSASLHNPITGTEFCSDITTYNDTEQEANKLETGDEISGFIPVDGNSHQSKTLCLDNTNLPPPTMHDTVNQASNTQLQRDTFAPRWIPPQIFQQFAFHSLAPYANPRWLQLYRQNAELPSMEGMFRQPFDTNLLRRVYANTASDQVASIAQTPQLNSYGTVSSPGDRSSLSVSVQPEYGHAVSAGSDNPTVNIQLLNHSVHENDVDISRSESQEIPLSQNVCVIDSCK